MDWDIYLRGTLALVFVLALIVGTAHLARRLGVGGAGPVLRRRRRLAIAETMALDGRRRLVLIERDGVGHLLMIGGGSDVVVERGIMPLAAGGGGAIQGETPAR